LNQIRLPVVAGEAAHPPTPSESVPEIARRSALVIDDEPDLAELLAEMIVRLRVRALNGKAGFIAARYPPVRPLAARPRCPQTDGRTSRIFAPTARWRVTPNRASAAELNSRMTP